jgi:phosphoglycolate phosphatase
MTKRIAALFDIDGTLIITGGAGAAAWRMAFDELYGIPADIGKFTDTGMTDPDVGFRTFAAVLGREPTRAELNKVMERRLHYLYQTVAESPDYRVLAGVEELLPQMLEQGYLLGLVTGNVEAAAHIKLHRSRLNRFFSFGGYGSDSTDRGELTRMALQRAAVVSGGSVTPDQAFVVGDTPHDVGRRPRRRDPLRWGGQPPLQRRGAQGRRRRLGDRLAHRRASALIAATAGPVRRAGRAGCRWRPRPVGERRATPSRGLSRRRRLSGGCGPGGAGARRPCAGVGRRPAGPGPGPGRSRP